MKKRGKNSRHSLKLINKKKVLHFESKWNGVGFPLLTSGAKNKIYIIEFYKDNIFKKQTC